MRASLWGICLMMIIVWGCKDSGLQPTDDAGLSGDTITSTDGPPTPSGTGAVIFKWTFAEGAEDCAGAGISTITVQINGEDTLFPCFGRGGQNGTVSGITPGELPYIITGSGLTWTQRADAQNKVTVVEGQAVTVEVDLLHNKGEGGGLLFQWTFDGGKGCSAVGVTEMQVDIVDRSLRFPCQGNLGQQSEVKNLPLGSFPFTITGLGNGEIRARASGLVMAPEETTTPFPVDLQLLDQTNAASIDLTWRFPSAQGCAATQNETVVVWVGDGAPVKFPCQDFATPGARQATLTHLLPGPVKIMIFTGFWEAKQQVTLVAGQTIAADFELRADLSPTINDHTQQLLWTFGGQSCTEAGVSQVNLEVGGLMTPIDQPVMCGDGSHKTSFSLTAGKQYPYTLSATGTGGVQYQASGEIFASDLGRNTLHADLLPVSSSSDTGDLEIDFNFSAAEIDCTGAAVDEVHLYLVDAEDQVVPSSEKVVACGDLPVTIQGLPGPASTLINAQARRDGATVYAIGVYLVAVSPGGTARYTVNMP